MTSTGPMYRPAPPPDAGESWFDPGTGVYWDRTSARWYDAAAGQWTEYREAPPQWAAPPPQQQWDAGPPQQWRAAPPPQQQWDAGPPQQQWAAAPTPPGRRGLHVGPLRGAGLLAVGGGVVVVAAVVVVLALVFTSGGGGEPAAAARPSGSASSSKAAGPPLRLPLPTSEQRALWPESLPTPFPAAANDGVFGPAHACTGKPQGSGVACAYDALEWTGEQAGSSSVFLDYVERLQALGLSMDNYVLQDDQGGADFKGENYLLRVRLNNTAAQTFYVSLDYFEDADVE